MKEMPARKPDRSEELAEICREHHSNLVRFLSARTGSAEDAKEIVQETYARMLTLERPETFSLRPGYLWRTAVNLAMDRWRERGQRERFRRSARALETQLECSAESTVASRERLAIVTRAIEDLPPRCLEAFVLHVLDGLRFNEVAQRMRISEQMGRRHVARALEYLQFRLDAADQTRSGR